ncbi:AP-2 adaptor complex subunit Alp3 [Schizosaccharomyces japonicus yFS275]|uniref:AP-2 complex subunit alpha n=1 Tax=Schizosaccharomyces japonicus (strain yFS275 / FY16936) TaxID=402676 RepID=B6JZX9_SCHJY|nr:AP-2 adaptor complex subunit Alp3 [Schizosaccharomyces japonicus yFS275]EEB06129.1 AP-2 adaptor complex subunit Alp3 [Schizosaccharomyces japonicus yFS275]
MGFNNMKGLNTFITDIRNLRSKEQEEKRVNVELAKIRAKFKGSTLNGYQKKKYICKLLYIYMMGYTVTFGHLESVNLLSSNKVREKQVGYLATAFLLHENHELIKLVINSVKKDLMSTNPIHNSFALNAVANIGGQEMCEAVYVDVHKLLCSPTSESYVRQKAALAMLHIYRKYPHLIHPEWLERLAMMLSDEDLDVSLSVASLMEAIAKQEPAMHGMLFSQAVNRLKNIVFEQAYTPDYLYYAVPCPWLQVRLLRVLIACSPTDDKALQESLHTVLARIISVHVIPSNIQQTNALHAILFDAIRLIYINEPNETLSQNTTKLLSEMIASKETNIRYLSFQLTASLISNGFKMPFLKKHKDLILSSLKYKDVSMRKKSLDLLYAMCDSENSKVIISDLLQTFPYLDTTTREDMVLKISVLTETHSKDSKWYVDVNLQLLRLGGDSVSDEVWKRLIVIIMQRPEIQKYAVTSLFKLLQSDSVYDSLIKIGGYIIGEYGRLISEETGSLPINQYTTIYRKLCTSHSTSTKALLLTTMLKFCNTYPDMKSRIMNIFDKYATMLDPEVQQRACEYRLILRLPNEVLKTVCDEMPPIDEKSQPLRTDLARLSTYSLARTQSMSTENIFRTDALDLSACYPGFARLCWRNEGVLFQDALLQIGVRISVKKEYATVFLYFGSRSATDITSFTSSFLNKSENLEVSSTFSETVLKPKAQIFEEITIALPKGAFEVPVVRVSCVAGVLHSVNLKIPIIITKFMQPVTLDAYTFFHRWGQMGQEREAQLTFALENPKDKLETVKLFKVVIGMQWGICTNVDSIKTNIVGAGIVKLNNSNPGCLLRLEPNYEKDLIRVSVRSTQTDIANCIAKIMQDVLSRSFNA